ncbi:MAG: FtsW/RodA/SpoVE family cell cycle protein [Verrucomicrobiales bacterium]|nr:FtsW/RodA/SpoVE family cell cycle protein [Verrucomicrobiales bacterium]
MTPLFRKFFGTNWLLFANMMALIIVGVFAIYSACWMRDDPELAGKWRSQVQYIMVGLVGFFAAALIDYRWIKKLGVPFYFLGLVLLILTHFFGAEINNSKSWIKIGPLSIQTSQIAICGGIAGMAVILAYLHRLHPMLKNPFVRLLLTGVAATIPLLLVLIQGDFGSAFVWIPVTAVMILVGNIPFRYITVVILIGTLFLPYMFFFGMKDYQKKRITVQYKMLRGDRVDTRNEAYNAHNNLMAIGSGGWTGKGFKNPDTINNKGFITPDTAINDFIFVVFAEEQGFRGALVVLAGFMLMLLQCLFVAFYSRDILGRLLVVGVVALIFAHIFQNVGMNVLLTPITGIPLPLVSYGGTFVVIVMFLLGIVQSVWIHRIEVSEESHRPAMDIRGLR